MKHVIQALSSILICFSFSIAGCTSKERITSWIQTLPESVQDSILWSADVEEGNLYDWTGDDGGGIFNTGGSDVIVRASQLVSHSGRFSAEATITNAIRTKNGSRAVRLMRWTDRGWDDGGHFFPQDAYYSVWMYFPATYNPNKYAPWDPGDGGWWNVFQFKSNDSSGENQPMWVLNVGHDDIKNQMFFYLYCQYNAPSSFEQHEPIPIPVRKWVHIECRYRQSSTTDGVILIWQDGSLILHIANVQTILAEPVVWGIGNYADHIAGGPEEGTATVYFDDAIVSTAPTHFVK